MRRILFIFLLVVDVWCESDVHIVAPLLSITPCGDTSDIVVWFEAGLPPRDNNRYYVNMKKTLTEDSKLTVTFDSPVNLTLTIKTDQYVRVSLTNGASYALHFFTTQENIGFLIKGTEPGVTPYLKSIIVNDVEYCNDPREGYLEQFAAKSVIKTMGLCGTRALNQEGLIVNGAPTKPGDWPWHAAIYRLTGSTMKYICGGTLISHVFVMTAAHCVSYRGAKYRTEIFSVVLGKYKLFGDSMESVERQVSYIEKNGVLVQMEVLEIIIHPRYDYRHLDSDIALIKLKTEVEYSDFIQPACLLRADDKSKLPSNLMVGTVVGWGFDQSDTLTKTLMQARMPMVSESTCLRDNLFYFHLSENSFCAGYHNGTSPCNGDSGSAFQVFIPDDLPDNTKNRSGTWHVKGIVSNAMARADEAICDPNQYVVFTDVEKFIDWIQNYL